MSATEQTQSPQLRRVTTEVCKVAECDRPADGSRGWCWAHYMRWHSSGQEPVGPVGPRQRPPGSCEVDGCSRPSHWAGLCTPHAKRAKRNGGDPGPAVIRRQAANGRGVGRFIASSGYVFLRLPNHPNAYKNGVVQEHTVVMSKMLGRPLLPSENVHHRNGDRTDNRPENLELWSTHQPKGQRVADKLAWAREIIDLYGDLPEEVIGTA